MAQGYMKPPPDAALAGKAASKAKKANKKKGGAGGSDPNGASGYRRYRSPGGMDILVGRNTRQNDELSVRVVQAQDIWMHVRGMPGSHTLLRIPPGGQPEQADLQCAADLAAYFSKARDAGKADVIVTNGAHVKKPKGAKPGAVIVSKELRNIVARPANSLAATEAAKEAG